MTFTETSMRPAQLTPENRGDIPAGGGDSRHFNEAGAINAGKHQSKRVYSNYPNVLQ